MNASQITQIASELSDAVFSADHSQFFAIVKSQQDKLSITQTSTYDEADQLKDGLGFPVTVAIYSRRGARLLDPATDIARSMTPDEFRHHVINELTRELSKSYTIQP